MIFDGECEVNIVSALAYDYRLEEEPRYEIIEGVRSIMSPAPNLGHATIIGKLYFEFINHILKNNIDAAVFGDNTDVYLPDGNLFMPDLTVLCNLDIADREGAIRGVPDMVVEVLSRSTMKKDIGKKKSIYERNGIKEYWIISPWAKSIEVYHLIDGKYDLDYIYQVYSDKDLERLTDKEREEINYYIKVSVFEDLTIDVRKIFKWWSEND